MSIWNHFIRGKAASGASEGGALPVAGRDLRQIDKNELSFHLAGKILKWQLLIATYLNTKTRSISKRKMQLSLVCFIALGCMYCLYLILSAMLLFLP